MDIGPLFDVKMGGAGRMEDMNPHGFRLAQYPDGNKRLQGAYQWSQGQQWGVVWRDIPTVYVGNDGEEVKYASGMVK